MYGAAGLNLTDHLVRLDRCRLGVGLSLSGSDIGNDRGERAWGIPCVLIRVKAPLPSSITCMPQRAS